MSEFFNSLLGARAFQACREQRNQRIGADPVSPALVVPYSVLGANVVVMPDPSLTITSMVATSTDIPDRSGFDDLDEDLFALLSINWQYLLGELPGGTVVSMK